MANEKEIVMNVVRDYARALNEANADLIPGFYTEDALFMPDGTNTINRSDLELPKNGSFLKKNKFNIKYSSENIVVEDEYAFVNVVAETSIENSVSGGSLKKTSRDFFVLRKENNSWKIFRYMFNNVVEAKS